MHTAEQRGCHVQALSARCLDAMLLATGCPCAAVGVDLRQAGLIETDQFNVLRLRLVPQHLEIVAAGLESGVVLLFLVAVAGSFPHRLSFLRCRVRALTWTGVACALVCCCSTSEALKAFPCAHCANRLTAVSSSLRGAPLRSLSLRQTMPSWHGRCHVWPTVPTLSSELGNLAAQQALPHQQHRLGGVACEPVR